MNSRPGREKVIEGQSLPTDTAARTRRRRTWQLILASLRGDDRKGFG